MDYCNLLKAQRLVACEEINYRLALVYRFEVVLPVGSLNGYEAGA